jgi:phasin
MTQPPFEMPESLRDLTEKSVEQTRQAFEAFWKASRAAVGSVESALPDAARDASTRALGYTEANMRAAFAHAEKLARAKDPQEVWRLQSDYAKTLAESIQEQMKGLSNVTQKEPSSKPRDAS